MWKNLISLSNIRPHCIVTSKPGMLSDIMIAFMYVSYRKTGLVVIDSVPGRPEAQLS